jgi:hypothetical protein
VTDDQVARLKGEIRRGDPHAIDLADELTVLAGVDFTTRMAAPSAPPERAGVHRMVHPQAGELRLAFETLDLPDADEQRLVVHLPADAATAAALDLLDAQSLDRPDAHGPSGLIHADAS